MSSADERADTAALSAELAEARAEQAATAEILAAIGRSDMDLGAVLVQLIRSAINLCGGERGVIWIRRGDLLHLEAHVGYPEEWVDLASANPILPDSGSSTATGRTAALGEVLNIADLPNDPRFSGYGAHRVGDYRGSLSAPLLRDGTVVGVLGLTRPMPGLFSDRQVGLLRRFASQAVVAVENARLFGEVQARTRDLKAALDQQTATADVLKVVSQSILDLDGVLTTIIDTAVRLCGGARGTIYLVAGDELVASAFHSKVPEDLRAHLRATRYRLDDNRPIPDAVRACEAMQIVDVQKDPRWQDRTVLTKARFGSMLYVPLVQDGRGIGCMAIPREEAIGFTDRDIGLVRSFADQAVIAVRNASLFQQVQTRTVELERSIDDLRLAQDRLVQTEKLASLGQLTAGIAHEIKNPLNFVNNFAALSADLVDELIDVLRPAGLRPAVRTEIDEIAGLLKGNLEKVASHGRRADSIVRTMLQHSRGGSGELRRIAVNALVDESLGLAYHGARAEHQGFSVALRRHFGPEAGEADVRPQELARVLLNLFSNGFYAVRQRAEGGEPGYEPCLTVTTTGTADAVEIRIHDNGTGMPEAVVQKLFTPFFTTKPPGEGTGLGLSLSHDIVVTQHGGRIDVTSEPGRFTEFRIVLPRDGSAAA
ncbi:GAF domain-containing protein [uncultured Alsobacter sp.]|uniref:GAF domain-containing protein n=1 Tax=uncultured Alsobacter sp. TaxID=1748258 RepID=UPI0025F0937B|nr:GAF domain-containing protein [uncultured Alsobacter sp.]